jgi:flagellar assembly factor FliW
MTTAEVLMAHVPQNFAEAGSSDVPVLEMVQPMAGFPDRRRFALSRLDESGTVCDLYCVDDPQLRFVVVPPAPFFADYTPEIDDSITAELGVESEDDLLALLVVTLGDTPESATANLLAPVLVNHRTRRAGQFLLDDLDLPLRAPLAPAAQA